MASSRSPGPSLPTGGLGPGADGRGRMLVLGGSGTPESWGREGCEPLLLGWVLWAEGSGEGTTY